MKHLVVSCARTVAFLQLNSLSQLGSVKSASSRTFTPFWCCLGHSSQSSHARFYPTTSNALSTQAKPQPIHQQEISTTTSHISNTNTNAHGKDADDVKRNISSSEVGSVIDLSKDKNATRDQIGFETESVLDSSWKAVRVDRSQLLFHYSKLSKKNLTGECQSNEMKQRLLTLI